MGCCPVSPQKHQSDWLVKLSVRGGRGHLLPGSVAQPQSEPSLFGYRALPSQRARPSAAGHAALDTSPRLEHVSIARWLTSPRVQVLTSSPVQKMEDEASQPRKPGDAEPRSCGCTNLISGRDPHRTSPSGWNTPARPHSPGTCPHCAAWPRASVGGCHASSACPESSPGTPAPPPRV